MKLPKNIIFFPNYLKSKGFGTYTSMANKNKTRMEVWIIMKKKITKKKKSIMVKREVSKKKNIKKKRKKILLYAPFVSKVFYLPKKVIMQLNVLKVKRNLANKASWDKYLKNRKSKKTRKTKKKTLLLFLVMYVGKRYCFLNTLTI